jgi:phage-related protein
MANSAILAIHIVANANDAARGLRRTANAVRQFQRDIDTLSGGASGAFARIGGSIVQMGANMAGATQAAAPLIGIVGSLALGTAGLAAVAAPALAVVALGFTGIANAARTIAPEFQAVRDAVSSTFEQGMTPAFQEFGGLITDLIPQLQGVAGATSQAFSGVISEISGPGKAGVQALLEGSKTFVETLTPGLVTLTGGLIDFGATAAQEAEGFGTSFGGIMDTIGEKFSAVPAALFQGFNEALGGLDALLAPVLDAFTQLGVQLGPVLASVLNSLATAVTGMLPALSEVGGAVGQALVTIFTTLAPVLPQIATAIANLTVALLPLIPPLAQFVASAGTGLAEALIAVTPLITMLATGLGQIVTFITPIAPLLAGMAIAWYTITAALTAYNAIMVVVRIATALWTAVQIAFNIAMYANPLGLIIAAVVILIGVIVLVATKTQFFQTVWEIMVNAAVAIWNAILDAVQWLMDKLNILIALVRDGVAGAWEDAKNVALGVWNAVKDAIQGVIDFVGRLIDKITGIRFPSPPGWMTSLFGGSGEAEFRFLSPDIMRFTPDVFQRFDAAPAQLTAASSAGLGLGTSFSNGSSGNVVQHNTTVHITVEGALDPLSTAKQITQLLKQQGITVGSTNARTF